VSVGVSDGGEKGRDVRSVLPRFGVALVDELLHNTNFMEIDLSEVGKELYYPLFLIMSDRFVQNMAGYGLPADKRVSLRYVFIDLGLKKPRLTVSVVRDFTPAGYDMLDIPKLSVVQSERNPSLFIPGVYLRDSLDVPNNAVLNLGATYTGHVAYINTNRRLALIPANPFGDWFYEVVMPRRYSPIAALIFSVTYLIGDVLITFFYEDKKKRRKYYALVDIVKATKTGNKPIVVEGPYSYMWIKSVPVPDYTYLKKILDMDVLEPSSLLLWLNGNLHM
jgi:hypothetical protein